MEHEISCFKFQARLSDFLDNSLDAFEKKQAEVHLRNCRTCDERLEHFQGILKKIENYPSASVPPQLKKVSKKYSLPRIELIWSNLARWEKLPWYLRTLLEGVGIVAVVMIGISMAPKIRGLYERSVEQSLSDYKDDLAHSEKQDQTVPPVEVASRSHQDARNDDEVAGEAETTTEGGHSASAQLWRFTLKTVSPDELRPLVVKTLSELKITSQNGSLGGLQVPGGIEFDLIIAETEVQHLKQSLYKLVAKPGETLPELDADTAHETPNDSGQSFSWYKVHSKQKLPEGKSKVIIWLAQPNG